MNIPANLIEQIAKENCVLFLGSGPSMAAGLPSWSQLLSQMIVWGEKQGIHFADKPEIERLINHEKFLLAAEELVERLGDTQFHRFMTETFDDSDLRPTEVHLLVAQIPFAAQVTTNYDPLSERGYEAIHNRVLLTFTQTDVAALSEALRAGLLA